MGSQLSFQDNTCNASSKGGQRAINKGVLLLLVPPAGFMSLGVAMAYRYSRKRDLEESSHTSLSLSG